MFCSALFYYGDQRTGVNTPLCKAAPEDGFAKYLYGQYGPRTCHLNPYSERKITLSREFKAVAYMRVYTQVCIHLLSEKTYCGSIIY